MAGRGKAAENSSNRRKGGSATGAGGRGAKPVRLQPTKENSESSPAEQIVLPLTVSRPELLPGGTDREFRRLVHGLFGFLSLHETIRSGHARAIGLAGIEYTVLISIAHLSLEGEVNVRSVAGHLYLTGAFITNVCHRLQALGLIDKRVDPKDRRRVSLSVTKDGRERLAALAPMQRQVNDAEFGSLTRDEFQFLVGMIDRLVESGERAVALQKYLEAEQVSVPSAEAKRS